MVCEMENPNLVGWAANSRLRRVDLPVPEGPQTTRGYERASQAVNFDASASRHARARLTRSITPRSLAKETLIYASEMEHIESAPIPLKSIIESKHEKG